MQSHETVHPRGNKTARSACLTYINTASYASDNRAMFKYTTSVYQTQVSYVRSQTCVNRFTYGLSNDNLYLTHLRCIPCNVQLRACDAELSALRC